MSKIENLDFNKLLNEVQKHAPYDTYIDLELKIFGVSLSLCGCALDNKEMEGIVDLFLSMNDKALLKCHETPKDESRKKV